jgi:NADPH2:quinone reductase
MRAVVVRQPGPFAAAAQVEVVPDPQPGAGQVVVDLHAIEVNFPDILVIEGKYQIRPPAPFSPGKAGAGVVSAVGPGVGVFKPGDRVALQTEYGAYAERIAVAAATCYPMPAGMAFVDAAALGLAYQTAHFALLDRASYRTGETILVTGATGGVGLAAVQLAKALGATVLAGVTSPEKGELARQHGADHAIDLTAANLRDSLRAQVHAVTASRGADVVLDSIGGDVFDAALRAVAWCGRLVVIGFASGRIPQIGANYLLVKNIAVSGLQWSDYRERCPERVRHAQEALFAHYVQGRLKPLIAATYPLDRFVDALARFAERTVQGKLILVPR